EVDLGDAQLQGGVGIRGAGGGAEEGERPADEERGGQQRDEGTEFRHVLSSLSRGRAQATGGMSPTTESRPRRGMTQPPRVKSGMSTGRPSSASDATLSGTGEHQAAES